LRSSTGLAELSFTGFWLAYGRASFSALLMVEGFSSKAVNISFKTGTVVATLLSPIGSEFKASHQSSYIGTAYLLSVCCFTPLYGKILFCLLSHASDYSCTQEDWRISWAGRARCCSRYPYLVLQIMPVLNLIVQHFPSGSGTILCGFAPSMKILIAARAIAGMGGGGYAFCDIFLPVTNCLFSVMTGEIRKELGFRSIIHRLTVASIAVTDLIPLWAPLRLLSLLSSHISPKKRARSLPRSGQHVRVASIETPVL